MIIPELFGPGRQNIISLDVYGMCLLMLVRVCVRKWMICLVVVICPRKVMLVHVILLQADVCARKWMVLLVVVVCARNQIVFKGVPASWRVLIIFRFATLPRR